MIVPLPSHGRPLGALLLARRRESPAFSDEEVSLAEELGRRAAIAFENARMYADIRAALQMRDEFLSIASHELRTPLTALQLYLQRLEQLWRSLGADGGNSAQVREKLAGATRQAVRLSRLVENLLDVSRISSGRLEVTREPVNLASAVDEVVDRFRDAASRVGCELRFCAKAQPSGRWDRVRLEQILDNLLSNALKYAPGHPITVTVEEHDESAFVHVRDEGIGIPREDAQRIFGRFERAVPVEHYGGLGLGLYIAQQIAEAHGGRILVESEPNRGSTFTVELPLRNQDERERKSLAPEVHSQDAVATN